MTKFSHVVALDTPKGMAAEFFAKKANELTKVRVEVYGNSTLYKDKEEMEALQLGAVQMLAPSLAKFGPLGVREFELFDLPYLYDHYTGLHKVTQDPIGHSLLEKLRSCSRKESSARHFGTRRKKGWPENLCYRGKLSVRVYCVSEVPFVHGWRHDAAKRT